MKLSKGFVLLVGVCLSVPALAGGEARLQATDIAKRVTGDVVLAKFSPDSKNLAYATTVPQRSSEMRLTEVKRISLSGGKPFTLLPTHETRDMGLDWGAHTTQLDWTSPSRLIAKVYNGDDGSRDYFLDVSRNRSLSHTDQIDGDLPTDSAADPALQALVPVWKPQALAHALKSKIDFPGHGVLVQKLYAQEDENIWWLDPATGRVRTILEERPGQHLELMTGFAFADQVLFAARRGPHLQAYLLAADGTVRPIEGLQGEAVTERAIVYHEAVTSNSGGVENRGCSADACWAVFWTDFDQKPTATLIRLDRQGKVELLDKLPGLKSIDISPDHRFVAAIADHEGEGRLTVYRIVDF